MTVPPMKAWRGRTDHGRLEGYGRWCRREELCGGKWQVVYTATTFWGRTDRFLSLDEAKTYLRENARLC